MKKQIYDFVFPLSHNPVPHQNNIKYTKTKAYKTKKLEYYQKQLGYEALDRMNRNGWQMIEKEFRMDVTFYCVNKKRGDRVNLLKSLEDALQGIVYKDDYYSVDGRIQIKYDKISPRIEVKIQEI